MKVTLEVPNYDSHEGLTIHWENEFSVEVTQNEETIYIRANKAGLVSLAIQLLTLAQDDVPAGRHIHYDCDSCLDDDSSDLIIEKIR